MKGNSLDCGGRCQHPMGFGNFSDTVEHSISIANSMALNQRWIIVHHFSVRLEFAKIITTRLSQKFNFQWASASKISSEKIMSFLSILLYHVYFFSQIFYLHFWCIFCSGICYFSVPISCSWQQWFYLFRDLLLLLLYNCFSSLILMFTLLPVPTKKMFSFVGRCPI